MVGGWIGEEGCIWHPFHYTIRAKSPHQPFRVIHYWSFHPVNMMHPLRQRLPPPQDLFIICLSSKSHGPWVFLMVLTVMCFVFPSTQAVSLSLDNCWGLAGCCIHLHSILFITVHSVNTAMTLMYSLVKLNKLPHINGLIKRKPYVLWQCLGKHTNPSTQERNFIMLLYAFGMKFSFHSVYWTVISWT